MPVVPPDAPPDLNPDQDAVAAAPDAAAGPKQPAYAALNDLFESSAAASDDLDNSDSARDAAFDLHTRTSAQLDALDLAVIAENSIALQASAAELTPAMKDLNTLKEKIGQLGADLKEGASLLGKIDSAVAELGKLGLPWV